MTIYTPELLEKYTRYIHAEVPRFRTLFNTNKIDVIDAAYLTSQRTGFSVENHCPPRGDVIFFILKDFFNLEEGRSVEAFIPFHSDILRVLATETVESVMVHKFSGEAMTEANYLNLYWPSLTNVSQFLHPDASGIVSDQMIKHAQEATLNVFRQLKYNFDLRRFGPEFCPLQAHPMNLMSEFLCNRDPEFQGEMLAEYVESFG